MRTTNRTIIEGLTNEAGQQLAGVLSRAINGCKNVELPDIDGKAAWKQMVAMEELESLLADLKGKLPANE